VAAIAFSPQGHLLASAGGDGTVRLWDHSRRAELISLRSPSGDPQSIVWGRDGRRLAAADSSGVVRVWATGTRNAAILTGHTDAVLSVAFVQSGRALVSTGWDRTVRLWTLADGLQQAALPSTTQFRPYVDSAVAATADGRTVVIWDKERGLSRWATATTRTPVPLEALASRQVERFNDVERTFEVETVAFGGQGSRLLVKEQAKKIGIWDTSTGKRVATGATVQDWETMWRDEVSALALSPDGRTIALSFRGQPRDASELLSWTVGARPPRKGVDVDGEVTRLAFTSDGQVVAFGNRKGRVGLWSPAKGEARLFPGRHAGAVTALTFTHDGRTLATGGVDQVVILWDAATGRRQAVLEGHEDVILCLDVSPDDRVVSAGSKDRSIRLWFLTAP